MAQYTLKILVDLDARDDLEARQVARSLVGRPIAEIGGVRQIVLHSQDDHKSIRMQPDGSFDEQWQSGGRPGSPVKKGSA